MRRNGDELALRHLTLAAACLRRGDRPGALYHVRSATVAGHLDEVRTGLRNYDVDVVWRTVDRNELRRTLIRVQAEGAERAHARAQDEVSATQSLPIGAIVLSSIVK